MAAIQGKKVPVKVMGPLHTPVNAVNGVLGDGRTCVIEMASAAGLGRRRGPRRKWWICWIEEL